MLKLIGAAVLIFSTSMAGMNFSSRLSARVRILETLKLMLEELSIQIRFRGLTVIELVQELTKNHALQEFTFLLSIEKNLKNTKNFSEAWSLSVDSWNIQGLKAEDKEFLKGIGNFLGNSDIDGQLSSLELSKEKLLVLQRDALVQCEKKDGYIGRSACCQAHLWQ